MGDGNRGRWLDSWKKVGLSEVGFAGFVAMERVKKGCETKRGSLFLPRLFLHVPWLEADLKGF